MFYNLGGTSSNFSNGVAFSLTGGVWFDQTCVLNGSGLTNAGFSPGFHYNGTNPGRLYADGSIRAIKDNIREIPDDDPRFNLDTFMNLKPVFFNPKEGHGNPNKNLIGFIAEDIQDLGLEELNTFGDYNNTKLNGIHYNYFTAYITKAVQLQQKIINNLKDELSDLKQLLKTKNII